MRRSNFTPNTLRRKMFSMGGSVPGHHGVGITSGMKYNKGGSVKPGVDGRPRVHASVGSFIANAALYGIPRAAQVIKGIGKSGFKNFARYGTKGTKAIDDKIDEIIKTGTGTTRDDVLKAYTMKELAKEAGVTASRGLGQAARIGSALGPVALGGGIGSAMFADDTPESRGEQYLREGLEGYLDFSGPGVVKAIYDNFNTPVGEDVDYQSISSAIKGINPSADDATKDILDESVPGIVERISAEDQLRQDFETRKALYQELMGDSDEGQNNLGVLGRSLMEASETLNQGKGYISAGNVFGTSLANENARRAERTQSITDAASTQAITDVMSENAANSAVMNEMLMAGDIDGVRNMKGINQAQRAGIPLEKIPTDNGGELDKEALDERIGTVFIDPDNVIGKGFFVAVNSKGEKASFNDVQAAIEFAET